MERVSERAVVLPNGERITVTVTRKKMKTCRLKVSRCGEVTMSVPLKTPEDWILRFLQERSSWLAERLGECAQLPPISGMDAVTDGGQVQFLGKMITVFWKSAPKKGGALVG
ncbi:MAG: YgjP-like metallopeptidase domain-containing protein, partial [Oscillospiraceae bacterium]